MTAPIKDNWLNNLQLWSPQTLKEKVETRALEICTQTAKTAGLPLPKDLKIEYCFKTNIAEALPHDNKILINPLYLGDIKSPEYKTFIKSFSQTHHLSELKKTQLFKFQLVIASDLWKTPAKVNKVIDFVIAHECAHLLYPKPFSWHIGIVITPLFVAIGVGTLTLLTTPLGLLASCIATFAMWAFTKGSLTIIDRLWQQRLETQADLLALSTLKTLEGAQALFSQTALFCHDSDKEKISLPKRLWRIFSNPSTLLPPEHPPHQVRLATLQSAFANQ